MGGIPQPAAEKQDSDTACAGQEVQRPADGGFAETTGSNDDAAEASQDGSESAEIHEANDPESDFETFHLVHVIFPFCCDCLFLNRKPSF